MPAKGRKRRQTRERRRGDGATEATMPARPPITPRKMRGAQGDGPLPSMTARVTGAMIAALTAVLAGLMVYQSVTGDATGIDGAARIAGGSALIVLAIVVAVLSIAPGMVRDWFARRRNAGA